MRYIEAEKVGIRARNYDDKSIQLLTASGTKYVDQGIPVINGVVMRPAEYPNVSDPVTEPDTALIKNVLPDFRIGPEAASLNMGFLTFKDRGGYKILEYSDLGIVSVGKDLILKGTTPNINKQYIFVIGGYLYSTTQELTGVIVNIPDHAHYERVRTSYDRINYDHLEKISPEKDPLKERIMTKRSIDNLLASKLSFVIETDHKTMSLEALSSTLGNKYLYDRVPDYVMVDVHGRIINYHIETTADPVSRDSSVLLTIPSDQVSGHLEDNDLLEDQDSETMEPEQVTHQLKHVYFVK